VASEHSVNLHDSIKGKPFKKRSTARASEEHSENELTEPE
jgi:hypothetical protein